MGSKCEIEEEVFAFLGGSDNFTPLIRKSSGEIFLSDPSEGYIILYRMNSSYHLKAIDKSLFESVKASVADSSMLLDEILFSVEFDGKTE